MFTNYTAFNFASMMNNDIVYEAKLDFLKFMNSMKQIIPDQKDTTSLNPTGTNYLMRGSSVGQDDQDPYE